MNFIGQICQVFFIEIGSSFLLQQWRGAWKFVDLKSGCLALLTYKIRTRKEVRVRVKRESNLGLLGGLAQRCGEGPPQWAPCFTLSSVLRDAGFISLLSSTVLVPTSTPVKASIPTGERLQKATWANFSDVVYSLADPVSFPNTPRKLEQGQVLPWVQSWPRHHSH